METTKAVKRLPTAAQGTRMLDAELCLGRCSVQSAHTLRLQPQLIVALVLCLTRNDTSAVASSSFS